MYSDGRSVDDLVQNGYSVDIGKYFGRGWEICKQNLGGFVGFTVVLVLIGLALGALPERLAGLRSIINLVISGPLVAGFYIVAFKLMKQQAVAFGDFFRGFNNFLPLFLTNLLVSIFTAIGFILLIVPGIYLAVAYLFSIPFVVGRKFDFWEAMESSRKVITKQWFGIFVFLLALLGINIVGALLLGVGLLVTIPLSSCAIAAAFEDIVGLPASANFD